MSKSRVLAIQPRLPVADLAASCGFYRDALGFDSRLANPTNEDGFVIVHRDALGLQLVLAREEDTAARITVWVQVGDAKAEHERVKAHAPIEWGPEVYWYGCREFAVLDPDGHRIIFSSPTDEPPTCTGDQTGS